MTTWAIPATGRHTSFYGPRNTGIPGASTFHRGHDIAPPYPGQRGVPVRSVGPGRVAGREYNSARGWFVRVRHDDGSMTLYQHLDRIDVVYGQRVATRTQVGLMGDTGIGAGVHLHFECYEAGTNAYVLANAVDPVAFLRRRGVNLLTGAQLVSNPRPTTPTIPTPPTERDWLDMATKAEVTEAVREGNGPLVEAVHELTRHLKHRLNSNSADELNELRRILEHLKVRLNSNTADTLNVARTIRDQQATR